MTVSDSAPFDEAELRARFGAFLRSLRGDLRTGQVANELGVTRLAIHRAEAGELGLPRLAQYQAVTGLVIDLHATDLAGNLWTPDMDVPGLAALLERT